MPSFETDTIANWNSFKAAVAPSGTTATQWDNAFETWANNQEDINVAFGHPSGRPRKRP